MTRIMDIRMCSDLKDQGRLAALDGCSSHHLQGTEALCGGPLHAAQFVSYGCSSERSATLDLPLVNFSGRSQL